MLFGEYTQGQLKMAFVFKQLLESYLIPLISLFVQITLLTDSLDPLDMKTWHPAKTERRSLMTFLRAILII